MSFDRLKAWWVNQYSWLGATWNAQSLTGLVEEADKKKKELEAESHATNTPVPVIQNERTSLRKALENRWGQRDDKEIPELDVQVLACARC